MSLAILNLGFDPVALMQRAKSAGVARVVGGAPWTEKDRLAKRAKNRAYRLKKQRELVTPKVALTVDGAVQLQKGEGKARVLGLAIGEVLPCTDRAALNRWQTLASKYGIHLSRCEGGLVRVAERGYGRSVVPVMRMGFQIEARK